MMMMVVIVLLVVVVIVVIVIVVPMMRFKGAKYQLLWLLVIFCSFNFSFYFV